MIREKEREDKKVLSRWLEKKTEDKEEIIQGKKGRERQGEKKR